MGGQRAALISCLVLTIAFFGTVVTAAEQLTLRELVRKGAVVSRTVWRWADDTAPKSISVCWENPNDENANGRSIVRGAVLRTWQLNSRLIFSGWEKCTDGATGIRILVADVQPMLRPPLLGDQIDGVRRGMRLNFKFKNFDPGCSEGDPNTWIARIAVHEFGHAIGFAHEQNRDDTPRTCAALKQGTMPDKKITAWDAESIMNYCYCVGSAELSPLDKASVQLLYGKP